MGENVESRELSVEADIAVQYMYKDSRTDLPTMGPLSNYTTRVAVECPSDLVGYMETYVANMTAADDPDIEPESYCADKDVVTRWKKWLKRKYPDEFAGKLTDDQVMEGAISCTVEDLIKDAIDAGWDTTIAEELGALPDVPAGCHVGAHFIHVRSWRVA